MLEAARSQTSDVIQILVENHRRFLSFLISRVGSRSDAEEILQAAFVKGLEKADTIRQDETVVAWFYRLLRNAVIDHYRHRDAERRALERVAGVTGGTETFEPDFEHGICECVKDLMPVLKDDYAALLRRVDLEGASIAEVASEFDMTTNNTRVKLHRARLALRKQLEFSCRSCAEHACLDCNCRRPN